MALLGLAAAAVAAEVLLRLAPGRLPETAQLRLHWWDTEEDIPKIAHPHLGFVHPPNRTGEVRHREFGFRFTTDGRGFRNTDPWGDSDVIVVGDSQAFGFGVDDAQGWAAVLERRLGGEVVNLGINGSAPLQQVRVLNTFRDELRPDTVLFGLFPGNALGAAGDFEAWLKAGEPEPFVVFRQRTSDQPLWKRALQWSIRQSRLLLFLRTTVDRLRTPYAGTTVAMPDGGLISFTPYVYAGHAALARPGEPRFERVLETIERARARAEADGSRFLVVLFPTKEEVYLPALDRPTPDVTGPFARALSARGIPYIDLLAAFRPRAAEGETLFLQVDIHPNEAGYALVADEVLKRLRSGAGRREAPAAGATRDGDALYANRANGFRQEPSGPR